MFEVKDAKGNRIHLVNADRMTIDGNSVVFEKVSINGNLVSSEYVEEITIVKGMSILPL